jgi:2-polyprenyl-3-methyl-5-hydroxy-6-metoxy-1,4-benzoquinol methylase
LFCANGAFSFEASLAGAKEVVGMEFSPDRVECAQFIASTFTGKTNCCAPSFVTGNVYDLARIFTGPFDVVLALGGLYHIADPPYVLTQIRSLTRERLIVQTHNVLNKRGNWGAFLIRQDKTARGLTSIVGGRGVWHFSVGCFESILHHADFRILESRRPSLFKRRRFPWYCASAEPI